MDSDPRPHTTRNGYIWREQLCPICEIPPAKFIGRRGGQAHRQNLGVESEIWSCRKCGLLFADPMPVPEKGLSQHYEVDADDYFALHDREQRLSGAAEMIKQAESLLGGKGRLIDIGVGRGEILQAAKERGWEVEGVEPSDSFADYAETRIGAKIWRKPVEEAALPEGAYDAVILAGVLEHLYNPDQVMSRVSRSLRKGGVLYLDVPNERGLYFRVGNFYQRIRRRNWCVNLSPTFSPFHIFGFSPRSLRLLLGKYDLEPSRWNVYGGRSVLPDKSGVMGKLEGQASKVITALSNLGEMGTYIETWAVKK
jgi:SAM-dependent methyltransferase